MTSLPIFAITGRALWFVVANAFTLFRLAWLPLTAFIAASWGLAYATVCLVPEGDFKTVSLTDAFGATNLTALLLQGLALSVVAVQVHRIILFDERRPNVYFAFPFGRTEFLYVLMGALTFAVLLSLIVAIVGGLFVVAATVTGGDLSHVFAALSDGGSAAPTAIVGAVGLTVGFLAAYVLIVWVVLRLSVWPPAVVANNKLALGEALRLSKGRVWALLALFIASSLATLPVFATVAYWAYRTGYADIVDYLTIASFDGKVRHALKAPLGPDLPLAEFVFQFFMTTYTVAILSYAYKALKGFDADVPIDGQSGEPADDPILHMKPFGAH